MEQRQPEHMRGCWPGRGRTRPRRSADSVDKPWRDAEAETIVHGLWKVRKRIWANICVWDPLYCLSATENCFLTPKCRTKDQWGTMEVMGSMEAELKNDATGGTANIWPIQEQKEEQPTRTLPLHDGKHPHVLPLYVVCQLHSGKQERTPEGHQNGWEGHWVPSTHTGGPSWLLLPQESQHHPEGLWPPGPLPV